MHNETRIFRRKYSHENILTHCSKHIQTHEMMEQFTHRDTQCFQPSLDCCMFYIFFRHVSLFCSGGCGLLWCGGRWVGLVAADYPESWELQVHVAAEDRCGSSCGSWVSVETGLFKEPSVLSGCVQRYLTQRLLSTHPHRNKSAPPALNGREWFSEVNESWTRSWDWTQRHMWDLYDVSNNS